MAEIKEIKDLETYNEFVDGEGLRVVKIGTDFCGPCKVLETLLRGLSNEDVEGVLLGEINADEEWCEDKLDELKIRGIPVLIAFKDGTEKERIVGTINKETLMGFFGRNK